MKKTSFAYIFILCFFLLTVSFIYGYYIGNNSNEKPNDNIEITDNNEYNEDKHTNEYISNENQPIIKDNETDNITLNTEIELINRYTECGHNITDVIKPTHDMINMNEDEFRIYISENQANWTLSSFSNKKVVIEAVNNYLCPDHFVISEHNGKIAVFTIDNNGNRVLDTILNDAPISSLKIIDQEKLEKGIIVDNREEISDILEDFIS